MDIGKESPNLRLDSRQAAWFHGKWYRHLEIYSIELWTLCLQKTILIEQKDFCFANFFKRVDVWVLYEKQIVWK